MLMGIVLYLMQISLKCLVVRPANRKFCGCDDISRLISEAVL